MQVKKTVSTNNKLNAPIPRVSFHRIFIRNRTRTAETLRSQTRFRNAFFYQIINDGLRSLLRKFGVCDRIADIVCVSQNEDFFVWKTFEHCRKVVQFGKRRGQHDGFWQFKKDVLRRVFRHCVQIYWIYWIYWGGRFGWNDWFIRRFYGGRYFGLGCNNGLWNEWFNGNRLFRCRCNRFIYKVLWKILRGYRFVIVSKEHCFIIRCFPQKMNFTFVLS